MYDGQGRQMSRGNTGYPPPDGPNNPSGEPYNEFPMSRSGYHGQHRPGMSLGHNYNQHQVRILRVCLGTRVLFVSVFCKQITNIEVPNYSLNGYRERTRGEVL